MRSCMRLKMKKHGFKGLVHAKLGCRPFTSCLCHFLIQTPIRNLETIGKSRVHVHDMSKTQLPLFTSSQKLLCTGDLRGRHRYTKRMLENFTKQEESLAASCSLAENIFRDTWTTPRRKRHVSSREFTRYDLCPDSQIPRQV